MKPLNEYDEKSIISEELIEEIFEEEDEIKRAYMIADCSLRAKELKVASVFNRLINQRTKIEREILRGSVQSSSSNSPGGRMTDFSIPMGARYNNMNCGSWVANGNGIVSYNVMGMEQRASYQPVLPVERLENIETGEEQIVLAFNRDRRWKEIKVAKDVISSSTKIVGLSKYGLSVTSENAKHLVKYLNDVENLDNDEICLYQSTSKLGWHGDDFIPYDTEIVFDGDTRFKQLFESIKTQGHEDVWLDHVRELRATGKPEIRLMLAASFASVLIKPLGILPFFVDLWGETEGGKSLSLMLATSVWANPDASQYIGDYKSTDVALEVRADMLNNLPVMLDDTSNATKRIVEDFENIIYRLCSGKGKSRSNKDLGANRENNWKCCFITNGERPLSGYVNQGGAINRIIEIEAGQKIYENPQATASLLKMNYGFAGKRFIEEIKQIDDLKEQYESICKELFDTDKMQKQAMSLACIILADRIATETIFKDNASISIDEAKSLLIDRTELSENERCYRYLIGKIAMNSNRFDATGGIEKWGFIEDGYACFYVPAFEDRLSEKGYSKKTFLSWAIKKGLVKADKGRMTKVVRVNDKTSRCIVLKLEEGISVDEQGFLKVDDTLDLPFE